MVEDEIIAGNLALVRVRIAESAERARRDPHDVTLVAVTKTVPVEAVAAAYCAGVREFGENRVQEAERKVAHWRYLDIDRDDPARWHLIGHLQTNKARPAAGLFAMVQSVDSPRVAEALSRNVPAGHELPVLLEVNVSGEESKSGFALPGGRLDGATGPAFLADAIAIAGLPGLRVEGLMTVAPLTGNPETVRPHFRALRALRDRLRERVPQARWRHLSMGMTGDYPVAVEEGATIVRVGRAVFGERLA